MGVDADFALIPIDQVLAHWADEIICMSQSHASEIKLLFGDNPVIQAKVVVLDIPDTFPRGDPELEALIKVRYDERRKQDDA